MNVERILQLADVIEKTTHRRRYSETDGALIERIENIARAAIERFGA